MGTTSPEPTAWSSGQVRQESLEERARRKGVSPIASVHDLSREGIWESDQELDEFLEHVRASRQADLA
ncbi:MAG TPA: hypothetical protein VI248_28060 [Kineosporiaceae bacterium]